MVWVSMKLGVVWGRFGGSVSPSSQVSPPSKHRGECLTVGGPCWQGYQGYLFVVPELLEAPQQNCKATVPELTW